MRVPFIDLKIQYDRLKREIDSAIFDCINNTEFIQGRHVKIFEDEFSEYLNVKCVVGCSNGTDALFLALKAKGVGIGDEIITAANSFIATAEAISLTGAKVVFADVEPETNNISPRTILPKITNKTKVLLPVYLYGLPADLITLRDLAEKYNLFIVGDCAQAHGAEIDGKNVAGIADLTAYSFFPGKNLGAFGDAGAVATDDLSLGQYISRLRNHGRAEKYMHDFEGVNMRMDEIQAAVLSAKLPFLKDWTEARRKLADNYSNELSGIGDMMIYKEPEGFKNVYHLYVIETNYRDELKKYLAERNISTGIHYPVPLPMQPAYKNLGLKDTDFPVCCNKAKRILSLPIFPEMDKAQQDYVIGCIADFFTSKERRNHV